MKTRIHTPAPAFPRAATAAFVAFLSTVLRPLAAGLCLLAGASLAQAQSAIVITSPTTTVHIFNGQTLINQSSVENVYADRFDGSITTPVGTITNSGIITGACFCSFPFVVTNESTGSVGSISLGDSGTIFNYGKVVGVGGARIGIGPKPATLINGKTGVISDTSDGSSFSYAVNFSGSGQAIFNDGGLITGGYSGIYCNSGSGVATIENSGTILGGSFAGIIASGGYPAGMMSFNITNAKSGLIAGGAKGVYFESGTLANAGTITGTSEAGIDSSGRIDNAGTGLICGANGITSYSDSLGTGVITNSGTIIGTATAGISYMNYATLTNTSTGLIDGNADGICFGLGLHSGNYGSEYGTFANSGTIRGRTGAGFYSNVAIYAAITNASTSLIYGGANGIQLISGSIGNSGTIIGTATAGIYSTGYGGTITNDTGALIQGAAAGIWLDSGGFGAQVDNAGVITGAPGNYSIHVWAYLDRFTLTNTGTINGDILLNSSTSTVNLAPGSRINGNLTITDTGSIIQRDIHGNILTMVGTYGSTVNLAPGSRNNGDLTITNATSTLNLLAATGTIGDTGTLTLYGNTTVATINAQPGANIVATTAGSLGDTTTKLIINAATITLTKNNTTLGQVTMTGTARLGFAANLSPDDMLTTGTLITGTATLASLAGTTTRSGTITNIPTLWINTDLAQKAADHFTIDAPVSGTIAIDIRNYGGIPAPNTGAIELVKARQGMASKGVFLIRTQSITLAGYTYAITATTISGITTVLISSPDGPPPPDTAAPQFTTQPQNTTITAGATATFTITATGNPAPTYQWQYLNGSTWTNLSNTAPYTGVTTATLTITAATTALNGTQYHCVATNSQGFVNSNAATLTIAPDAATADAQNLKNKLQSTNPADAIVTVTGVINLSLAGGATVASGKTIIGADATSTITGNLTIPATASDVVITGINFTNGTLAITGATDIDISHCTFTDTPIVITGGADNISFSWNHFTATSAGSGSGMTINGTGATTGVGIILDHNLWGDGLRTNMPTVTNARVFMFNNYFTSTPAAANTNATLAGAGAQILSQNNIYQGVNNPLMQQSTGLIHTTDNLIMPDVTGSIAPGNNTVFVPAYSQVMQPAGIGTPLNANTLAKNITAYAGNKTGQNSFTPAQTTGTAAITATVTGVGSSANATGATVPDGTAGGSFTLTAKATGFTSNPTAWQWYLDNIVLTNKTASTYNVPAASPADAGNYSVAITTNAGDIVTAGAYKVTITSNTGTNNAGGTNNNGGSSGGGGGGGGAPSLLYLAAALALLGARASRARKQWHGLPACLLGHDKK